MDTDAAPDPYRPPESAVEPTQGPAGADTLEAFIPWEKSRTFVSMIHTVMVMAACRVRPCSEGPQRLRWSILFAFIIIAASFPLFSLSSLSFQDVHLVDWSSGWHWASLAVFAVFWGALSAAILFVFGSLMHIYLRLFGGKASYRTGLALAFYSASLLLVWALFAVMATGFFIAAPVPLIHLALLLTLFSHTPLFHAIAFLYKAATGPYQMSPTRASFAVALFLVPWTAKTVWEILTILAPTQ